MDWDIAKTSIACAGCEKEFAEGEEVFSALHEDADGFRRKDYCAGCWPGQDGQGAFSFWRTQLPASDAPVRQFVDDDVVLDLFRRLEGHAEPEKRNFRYVLALLLMRKKVLKFREFLRDEAGDRLVLCDRNGDARHEVPDTHLTEEQIQKVTDEIGQILNVKL